MSAGNLITSKEIIEKTGISRATLNNYIKMGILPKPIVRRPGPEQKSVKQIGYFPASVLENILKVKLLKQQGNSMDDISQQFQKGPPADVIEEKQEAATPPVLERRLKNEADVIEEKQETATPPVLERRLKNEMVSPQIQRRVSDSELQVTIADINSPAYLVNHNFEIEWINKPAEDLIFNRNIKEIVDIESRNVFRLLLNKELRKDVQNWQDQLLLHLSILQNRINANNLSTIYEGINDNDVKVLADLFKRKDIAARENIYNVPVSLVKSDNSRSSYWVHSMSFREGTFFVYVPTDSINTALLDMLSQRGKIINDLLKNRMPSLVSLCVLIADLQDSVKISAELLPAQYFELINELWQSVGPTVEKYNAIYGKHAGDGMLYYFIQRPGVNYLTNAVNCALEIREIMKELSSKWRLRKGWNNELFLNTGINEGQEFFGTIQSANNIEFTALGDTINIAGRLSDFAQNGEIWTTKNLISRFSQEERNMIRFGVHQENQTGKTFIRNSFSRISDIMTKDYPHFRHLSAISGLPITEIKEKVDQSAGIQDFGSN
jgi:class 3 adenylate cyclase/DNA-binding transcriptional MerR regulator